MSAANNLQNEREKNLELQITILSECNSGTKTCSYQLEILIAEDVGTAEHQITEMFLEKSFYYRTHFIRERVEERATWST